MEVVGDVLDAQVVDRDGREMGRVDGIVLEYESDAPPRLSSILIGPAALAHRLHPALGRFVSAAERRFGLDRDRPALIPFDAIDRIEGKVMLRTSIRDTGVDAVEDRLRAWLLKLPGSR